MSWTFDLALIQHLGSFYVAYSSNNCYVSEEKIYHSPDTVGNGHVMFLYIYIEHRNLETRKTRNDFLIQVQNFLLPLRLKVLRHKERDTHSFYSGFFICPHILCAPAQGLPKQAKVNCLLPRQSSIQLTDFLKIPKFLPALLVCDVIRTC